MFGTVSVAFDLADISQFVFFKAVASHSFSTDPCKGSPVKAFFVLFVFCYSFFLTNFSYIGMLKQMTKDSMVKIAMGMKIKL